MLYSKPLRTKNNIAAKLPEAGKDQLQGRSPNAFCLSLRLTEKFPVD